MQKYTVAIVQMDTQNDKEQNLRQMERYLAEAAEKGAKLVTFPEVTNVLSEDPAFAETIPGPTVDMLCKNAQKYNLWIHGGSISELNPNGGKTFNTSVMINPKGEIVAKYSKIHNFDMMLPDGTQVRESDRKEAGKQIVTVDTELGTMGLAICYDIRFPELFRIMMLNGAKVMIVAANFTYPTGKEHWETILRTRAIENGCYVVATNQIGTKEKFEAYGHSMVIDPWGKILACAEEMTGVFLAEIDLDYVDEVRRKNPISENRREDVYFLAETCVKRNL